MPTAQEYDGYSTQFTQHVSSVNDARAAVAAERSKPGIGGAFASLVDTTIDSITDRTRRAADDLDSAASECTRRADICESFAEDMRLYRQALDRWQARADDWDPTHPWTSPTPGPQPAKPEPPHSWVEI